MVVAGDIPESLCFDRVVGYIHFATTINSPTTLTVVDVINAIRTESESLKSQTLKPDRTINAITNPSQQQTNLKILPVYSTRSS